MATIADWQDPSGPASCGTSAVGTAQAAKATVVDSLTGVGFFCTHPGPRSGGHSEKHKNSLPANRGRCAVSRAVIRDADSCHCFGSGCRQECSLAAFSPAARVSSGFGCAQEPHQRIDQAVQEQDRHFALECAALPRLVIHGRRAEPDGGLQAPAGRFGQIWQHAAEQCAEPLAAHAAGALATDLRDADVSESASS